MQSKQEEEEKTQNVKIRNTPTHVVLVHPPLYQINIQPFVVYPFSIYLKLNKKHFIHPSVRPSIHPPTICSHMVQMAVLTNFIRCKNPEFIVWYGPTGKYNGQNFQQIEKKHIDHH